MEVQPLAKNSHVTRSTEVIVSHPDTVNVLDGTMNKVSISTDFTSPDEFTLELDGEMFVLFQLLQCINPETNTYSEQVPIPKALRRIRSRQS